MAFWGFVFLSIYLWKSSVSFYFVGGIEWRDLYIRMDRGYEWRGGAWGEVRREGGEGGVYSGERR
jgi:hypothetical protein